MNFDGVRRPKIQLEQGLLLSSSPWLELWFYWKQFEFDIIISMYFKQHWQIRLLWVNFELSFWYLQFSQKRTKKFDFTTIVPQVELFSFVFWEN